MVRHILDLEGKGSRQGVLDFVKDGSGLVQGEHITPLVLRVGAPKLEEAVPRNARDDVEVRMEDNLSGVRTIVLEDVHPGGPRGLLHSSRQPREFFQHIRCDGLRHVHHSRVPASLGDQQGVPRCHRKDVQEGHRVLRLEDFEAGHLPLNNLLEDCKKA